MITELDMFDTDIEEDNYLLCIYSKIDIPSFSVKNSIEKINELYPKVFCYFCEAECADSFILNYGINVLPSVLIFKNKELILDFHGLVPFDVLEYKVKMYLL